MLRLRRRFKISGGADQEFFTTNGIFLGPARLGPVHFSPAELIRAEQAGSSNSVSAV